MTFTTAVLAEDIIPVFIRGKYLDAGRTPPSDAEIRAIIVRAREQTEPPLTVRKLVRFLPPPCRPWEDVQRIIEEAATPA